MKIFLLSISIRIIILYLSINVVILFFNIKERDYYLIDNIFNILITSIKLYLFSY